MVVTPAASLSFFIVATASGTSTTKLATRQQFL